MKRSITTHSVQGVERNCVFKREDSKFFIQFNLNLTSFNVISIDMDEDRVENSA